MKRIGIGLAMVVGLLLLANCVMALRVESRSSAMKAAIRAAGDPASITDLKPTPILAAANAAAQIDQLTPAANAFGKDQVAFLERTELGQEFQKAPENLLPNKEQTAAMRAILDARPELRDGITRAAACDAWASTVDFSLDHPKFLAQLMTRVQDFRGVMRYADWDMLVLASEGRGDEAVDRGVELLKLARLHEAEPTLLSFLVSVAVRNLAIDGVAKTLRSCEVSPETRATLDAELARVDQPGRFAAVLRSERGAAMDAFDPGVSGQVASIYVRLVGWSVKRYYLDAFDSMTEVIKAADGPWGDFRQLVGPWNKGNAQTGHGVLADLLAPAIAAGVEAYDRDLALVRSLRLLNALQQEGGADTLPAAATVDPYTDKPLLVKQVAGGWVVYSVGVNGKDDGGDLTEMHDVGVSSAPAEKK